jgi:uncharacterized membrane protein YhaH (DUF805 family)
VDITRLWFSFKGRINRGKYWLVTVINTLIVVALVLTAIAANSWAIGILAMLIIVPLFVSSLAVALKRLHDREKSAWWLLLFYLLPALLYGIANVAEYQGLVFSLISLAISIWALVELGCRRGTPGANPHGPDPLEGRG